MAITKQAYLRYKVIDRCLQSRTRKFGSKDLLNEVNKILQYENPDSTGVGIRTIHSDLIFMKSENGFSAPIEDYKEGRFVFYKYEDKDFSILNHPIKNEDYKILLDAVEVLSKFNGLPQLNLLHEIIPYIQDKILIKTQKRDVISFETNIDYKGYDFISPLYQYINEKQVLLIDYEPFDAPENYQFKFHPYHLKQFNNRWFCFGFNEKKETAAWNVPLDRINSIKVLRDTYIDCDIDWDEYFYDIVGVTKLYKNEIEDIVLKFKKGRANYVKTKPLHASQRIEEDEKGNLIVKLKVIVNRELLSLIYSFGPDVEVVKPLDLFDRS